MTPDPLRRIRSSVAYKALCRQVRAEENVCWLCGEAIDLAVPYRDAAGRIDGRAWSLDHVIPLSQCLELGLVRENCRSAHVSCNTARGARPPEQRRPAEPLVTSRVW